MEELVLQTLMMMMTTTIPEFASAEPYYYSSRRCFCSDESSEELTLLDLGAADVVVVVDCKVHFPWCGGYWEMMMMMMIS